MTNKKYKEPLSQTRMIDKWKCPYCRVVNGHPDFQNDISMMSHDEVIKCPNEECGKWVHVMTSPEFTSVPVEDQDEWERWNTRG